MQTTTHLLRTSRFLPLFVAQFLGAFNDNLFKNAVIVLGVYGLAADAGVKPEMIAALASGLFILPFVLFSATAGQLSDRYEKTWLIRLNKAAEIFCMALAGAGLILENLPLMLAALFLLGIQAAFFGTLKYSILPAQLHRDELIGGNGLMEAGTFLAILTGTMAGGLMVVQMGVTEVALLGIVLAIIGWGASLKIPYTGVKASSVKVDRNIVRATWEMFRYARKHQEIAPLLPAIAWFWLMGSVLLSQLPALVKDTLHGNEEVITLCLALFSVGIALGSILCNRLLKGEVSGAIAPMGAVGMGIFTLLLAVLSTNVPELDVMGMMAFLSAPYHWGILGCLFMIAMSGGIYVVPLQAMLQLKTEEHHRARMIAASNMMSALFMVMGSAGVVALLAAGFTLMHVLMLLGVLNGIIAYRAWRLNQC